MATFETAAQLSEESAVKALLKTALAKVNANPMKFLYYEKFPVGSKTVPLALVDYVATFQALVKTATSKVPSAVGRCRVNEQNELVFEADAGTIKLEALKSYLALAGVKRAVHIPPDKAPTADAKTEPKAKTVDGPPPSAKQTSASSELVKRMTQFKDQLKALKPELRDSFESQLNKAVTLAAKDEAAALKLLAQLDPMLKRALDTAHPEVANDNLKAVLANSAKLVDEAMGRLPTDNKTTVVADAQKLASFAKFDGYKKKPDTIPDVASLRAASQLVIQQVNALAEQVQTWTTAKTEANKRYQEAHTKAASDVGKPNAGKLKAWQESDEFKAALKLGADASAYGRADEFTRAINASLKKLTQLVTRIQAWEQAVQQARQQRDKALSSVATTLRVAVETALANTTELKNFDDQIALGASKLLPPDSLAPLTQALLQQITLQADLAQRRAKARELLANLPTERQRLDAHVLACTTAIGKANAPLSPAQQSFFTGTQAADLAADALTCTQARTATQALIQQIDQALTTLGNEPPPSTQALTNAEQLIGTALADITTATKRINVIRRAVTPEGIAAQIDQLLDAAKTDPARQLASGRAGTIKKGLQAMTQPQVVQAIAAEVAAQHSPKLKEWFKVLQLGNASNGKLKLGKVGDIQYKGKRTELHLSLFLANVTNPPPVTSPVPTIMNALLPAVNGDVGTHVTLEVGDYTKGAKNPHFFHGAASGVANDLVGDPEWGRIEGEMQAKLNLEIARLTGLVTAFCGRMGKWPGE
jgi:hypothetical protein